MSLGVRKDAPSQPTGYLRALAHPLRLRLLSLLTGAPLSAAEAARALDLGHANVSYHLRQLLAAGLVEVAEERSVRGGQERRYRPTAPRSEPELGRPESRVLMAAALGEELRRRSALADPAAPGATADAELWVAPELWQDVRDRIAAALVDLHSGARPPGSAGARRVSASVALFGMAPGGPACPAEPDSGSPA